MKRGRHFCHGAWKHGPELGSCKVGHDLLSPREHSELKDNIAPLFLQRMILTVWVVSSSPSLFLILSAVQNQVIKNVIKAMNFALSNRNYLIYRCLRRSKKIVKMTITELSDQIYQTVVLFFEKQMQF